MQTSTLIGSERLAAWDDELEDLYRRLSGRGSFRYDAASAVERGGLPVCGLRRFRLGDGFHPDLGGGILRLGGEDTGREQGGKNKGKTGAHRKLLSGRVDSGSVKGSMIGEAAAIV